MGAFNRKYSDEQREAVTRAYVPRKVPIRKVVELAASGQLKDHKGEPIAPFDIPADTARKIWERERARSLGQVDSPLADANPRDAVEILRRRLINVCDSELRKLERKPPGKRDMELVRQIGRAAREAAALPGPNDPKPRKPGSEEGSSRTEGTTRGGLGGSILHAARGEAAQNAPPTQHLHGETETGSGAGVDAHAHDAARAPAQDAALAGSRASEQTAAHAMA